MVVESFISAARKVGASDVHLSAGHIPLNRVDGTLVPAKSEVMSAATALKMASELSGKELSPDGSADEIDLAKTICGTRCRVNLYRQKDGWSAAIRLLSDNIPDLSDIGVPPAVFEFPSFRRGLVLVTGETGSGKSTTLAAILDRINKSAQKHILTLEDPIEYVYENGTCLVTQREVGRDTASFANGLRAALREDPDVILVGEMRDFETIETALTAAETGHLVFGTVHTNSASDSVDRLVDVFPSNRQPQIRMQLSMALQAILSQQLLPKVGGGRVLACEIMKPDIAMRKLIREGDTHQLPNYIQSGSAAGNILMEKSLSKLLASGVISQKTYDAAMGVSSQRGTDKPSLGGMDGMHMPSHVAGRR